MTSAVCISGIGIVSSIGNTRDEFWSSLVGARSGAVKIDHPAMQGDRFYSRIGAPVKDFPNALSAKDRRVTDRVAQFALVAAIEALADSGYVDAPGAEISHVELGGVDPEKIAVVMGTGNGGFPTAVQNCHAWGKEFKRSDCSRFTLPMIIPNAIAANVAIWSHAKGECKSISTACSAGTMAIGDAYRLIRDGEADIAICGGAEAPISDELLFGFLGFDLLRVMSQNNDDPQGAMRPFDVARDGFVIGEGAGVVVLEREDLARKRGKKPYATIGGYGSTCDGHSMVQIDQEGREITRAMRRALDAAKVNASDVDYINAHGTATKLNDVVESQSIERVFGEHAKKLMVSSIKANTGHAIGASGALEIAATALALKEGVVPPTLNLTTPDPECRLDYVPREARRSPIKTAMSNSFAFGGHNACVVMKSAD